MFKTPITKLLLSFLLKLLVGFLRLIIVVLDALRALVRALIEKLLPSF